MTADPNVPAGKRTVVAVLLPREHLPFIRDWCLHHIEQGWEIALYDNTGSVGSTRETSTFSLARWHGRNEDKRGNSYGTFTEALSDHDVQDALRHELRDLPVTIFEWQPRDPEGRVVHGQVEAYVDYITKFRDTATWTAFIDADEYLQCAPGLDWDELLHRAAEQDCHRILLDALAYEPRWTKDGQPRDVGTLNCLGLQKNGSKNILQLPYALKADIHWNWKTTGTDTLIRPDRALYSFRHHGGDGGAIDYTPRQNFGPPDLDECFDIPPQATAIRM
ncbi:glycosyltransferase family 92 protein [Rhodococcus sp. ARC_M6]|uniref:glycosyltransferase family 92 protein n=1 Tax=Rhodococcus sp. ARC_M6 TaxID=2928852 RepID=UPI001FB3BA60|nr:glycosyltransferase family 92 protein [Rhodococcus sp. ARC_M6]MCJ0902064.1 glycosyltransferase family 92 protein [Rhodococcus sp. ARC_M6]